MPCDVRRLVKQRLRAHGDDVAEQALASWDAPELGAERFANLGAGRPFDARLWLTPWPFDVLARELVRPQADRFAAHTLPDEATRPIAAFEALPANEAPIFSALESLLDVDPAGFGLLMEASRGPLELVAWRGGLGESEGIISERVALALFRFLVLRNGVLSRIEDPEARACLAAKRFRGGDASEFAALGAARAALANPSLTVVALRELEQRGASAALDVLSNDPEISVLLAGGALTAFRRALRLDSESALLDDRTGSARDGDTAYAGALFALVDRDVRNGHARTPEAHPTAHELSAFVAGEVLPLRRRAIVEHLTVCRDSRCARIVRAEICGRHAVLRALSGPMTDPPPAFASGPLPSAYTPRMVRCRDVLWDTFSAMAEAEGREVDDLVDEAMDRYRTLRTHVARPQAHTMASSDLGSIPEPPTTRRSTIPPGSSKSGLRLGDRRSSAPPADPSADEVDEPTQPTRRS